MAHRWEGYIDKIKGEEITAVVVDLAFPSNPREEITLTKESAQLPEGFVPQMGSVFTMEISSCTPPAVRFSWNTECWTKEELENAHKRAEALSVFLEEHNARETNCQALDQRFV